MKRFLYVVCSMLFLGCGASLPLTKLEKPITNKVTEEKYKSNFDVTQQEAHTASIGDLLFIIDRSLVAREVSMKFKAPTGSKFPSRAIWNGKYKLNEGKSEDFIIYTTPKYYNGHIGIILNSKEELATNRPLIQIRGMLFKKGRRWEIGVCQASCRLFLKRFLSFTAKSPHEFRRVIEAHSHP
ncbi:MAG: hypothetical protein GY730_11415 [bacterium]|nr:hypothetical protein [bacterium]